MSRGFKLFGFVFAIAIAITVVQGGSAHAQTSTYPYPDKPCVWSPHKTKGTTPDWCPNYDWGDTPNSTAASNVISPYGYYYRNCTDYAAWKAHSRGVHPDIYKKLGNAKDWADKARRKGIRVDTTPAVGSVGVRTTGKYGHTAFVEEVRSDGTIRVSQFNARADGNYSESVGTPAHFGFSFFVHFEDHEPQLVPPPAPPQPSTPQPIAHQVEPPPTPELSAEVVEQKAVQATVMVAWTAPEESPPAPDSAQVVAATQEVPEEALPPVDEVAVVAAPAKAKAQVAAVQTGQTTTVTAQPAGKGAQTPAQPTAGNSPLPLETAPQVVQTADIPVSQPLPQNVWQLVLVLACLLCGGLVSVAAWRIPKS